MEGAAEHVGRRGDGAGDEAVDHAAVEHHVAEVEALRADGLVGLLLGHALGLAALVEGGDELGGDRGLRVVKHFDARVLKGDARLGFGGGEFLGRGEDDGGGDLLGLDLGGGDDDAGIVAFGEDEALVSGLGLGEYGV